jgi:hypothetical protein
MNFIIEIVDPTDDDDLKAIEKMLSEKNVICSSYQKDLFDQYSYLDYRKQIDIHNNKFSFLLDRNIFSEIISFAKKDDSSQANETQKRAFGLLAFIQSVDGLIDPEMAIYEYMDSNHYDEAIKELSLFRCIYNLPYKILVDIALGRIHSIPPDLIKPFKVDPIRNLKGEDNYRWKLHYGLTLKLASIEISGSKDKPYDKPYEKMEVFLKWIHKDYIFSASAITFGLIYFSENRIKNMVKNLKSNDKDKLVKGIRNATWDMTIASHLAYLFIENRKRGDLSFFCTEDKALKAVSNSLIAVGKSDSELTEIIKNNFLDYFGKDEGTKINDLYKSLVSNLDDRTRKENGLKSPTDVYPYIDVLEKELMYIALTESSNTTLSR